MNMKKILVLLLTLTMLTSAFSPALSVFANTGDDQTSDKPIKYVSIGDSMSNGLGFWDNGYDATKHNGYLEVVPDAYPAQFAAWLAGMDEADVVAQQGANILFEGTKGKVELTQLATSGARAEDILYMLYYDPDKLDVPNPNLAMMNYGTDDQGLADYWVKYEMLENHSRWAENSYYGSEYSTKEFNDLVAKTFQDSVRDADIISYSGANGNYGVFFVHRVLNIVGLGSEDDHQAEKIRFAYMNFENAIKLLEEEADLDEKYTKDLIEYVTTTYNDALVYMEENKLPKDMMVEIADYLAYITASYLVTFDKTMDYITKVNPDAEVIILPLINNATTFNIDVTVDGNTTTLNAGEMMDMVYGSVNAYTAFYTSLKQASGDSGDVKFYYASLPTDENGDTIQVQTFVEVLEQLYVPIDSDKIKIEYNADGSFKLDATGHITASGYPENRLLCHNRFVEDIREFIFPILMQIPKEDVPYFDETNIRDYEVAKADGPVAFIQYCSANSSLVEWITQYLGVIDAVMSALSDASNLDIDQLGVEDFSDVNVMTLVAPFLATLKPDIEAAAYTEVVLHVMPLFREALIESNVKSNIVALLEQFGAFDNDDLMNAFGLNAEDEEGNPLYPTNYDKTIRMIEIDSVEGEGNPVSTAMGLPNAQYPITLAGAYGAVVDGVDNELANNTLLQALMAAWCTPSVMDEELNDIGIVSTLLSVYGRMKLNNGLSCHPSATGHDTLTLSLVECYEDKYTTVDETVENLKVLLDYLEKNPNLVYSYAYDKVVEEGYIDTAVKALDETLAILDLAADNVGLLGLTPELEAEVLAEINAVIATLDDLKAALVNGDARTIEGLMALVDKLEADLDTHIANVEAILAQAGYDVENVLVPALLDAKAKFEDEVVPVLFDMAEEFAWVAVDFLLTNIDEIYYNFPEIANTVYAKALEVAIMVQILVGDTVDYVVETAYDVYFLVYNTVLEYYDDVEAAIAEADRIIHELYTTLVTIDNRLGNPSKDFLDGKSIEEWANLFNELYHRAEGDVEVALEQLDVIIADLLVIADGEYAKAIVVFNAILKGIGSGYDTAEDAVVVAGQIFSYVYDFVVEDLTLAELKAACDGLVDTIALTYENTKSVDAVGIAIYNYVLGLFDDTFTGDYQLTVDSLYVSLGNATYGEELAELLHLGDKYHNFGLSEDYLDTLADADFVTVRLDNGEAMSFAVEQLMSIGSSELDWSKHLDAEGQAALDRVLSDIENDLRSSGAADQLAIALNGLVEEYADGIFEFDGEFVAAAIPYVLETSIYAYADAIDRLETVLANVKTVAPEATVVITGIQNPLDTLDLSAFGLDIGEYAGSLDYVVDIFNVQLVAIAYANDNIIYVDSVEAADIYAALTVTCVHDYDDCEDTICNICGEERIAPGHTYGDYVSNGDAKCGVDGTKTRTCSACGKKDTVADTGSALEHDWTEWTRVKEPTNKEEGLEQRTCKLCGEIETRPIPAEPTPWGWIIGGSVVVLAAVAGVLYYRKKKAAPATEENKK